jgi:chitinase
MIAVAAWWLHRMMQTHLRWMGLAVVAALLLGCTRSAATDMPSLAPTPTNLPPVTDTAAPTGTSASTGAPVATARTGTPTAATPATQSTDTPTPTPSARPTPPPPAAGYRLVGYFPSFALARKVQIVDLPAAQLTHIIYAFETISDTGECAAADAKTDATAFPALRALKAKNPTLKTLVSIGGYSRSAKFSDVAATVTARRKFAQSCARLMQSNGFDGIDVDWEFPVRGGLPGNAHRPEDKQNFTLLLVELRSQLDMLDGGAQHSLLTAAVPAGPNEYANLELGSIGLPVDWLNLMAYDFYTGASRTTNFAAPLFAATGDPAKDDVQRLRYNADAAVKAYRSAGVPADKLVLGVPFYGRGWRGVRDLNKGLFQPNQGPAQGTWAMDGAFDYADLVKNFISKYTRYWDAKAQAPWLYNAKTGVMIAYDDAQSLGLKADYVRANGLGGVMIWQLTADDPKHTLLEALYGHLRP